MKRAASARTKGRTKGGRTKGRTKKGQGAGEGKGEKQRARLSAVLTVGSAQAAYPVKTFVSVGKADGRLGGKPIVAQPAVNVQGVQTVLQVRLEQAHTNSSCARRARHTRRSPRAHSPRFVPAGALYRNATQEKQGLTINSWSEHKECSRFCPALLC